MRHRVSELQDEALRTAVALAEGFEVIKPSGDWILVRTEQDQPIERYAPDRRWEHGGPIIEREHIMLVHCDDDGPEREWGAQMEFEPRADGVRRSKAMFCPTPLIAAMRAFVASKFGDEIDIPG